MLFFNTAQECDGTGVIFWDWDGKWNFDSVAGLGWGNSEKSLRLNSRISAYSFMFSEEDNIKNHNCT